MYAHPLFLVLVNLDLVLSDPLYAALQPGMPIGA
jgi:hypothetical protein